MGSLHPFLSGKRTGKSFFPQLKPSHWLENPKCLNWNYVPLCMLSSITYRTHLHIPYKPISSQASFVRNGDSGSHYDCFSCEWPS